MSTAVPEDTRAKPVCRCCGGSGEHELRAYASPSPYDLDATCTACAGTGETWHATRQNSCSGYYSLAGVR